MKVSLPCVVLVGLLLVGRADAQTCSGNPTFRDNPYQVGVAGLFTEGAHGIEGTYAVGGESLFGGVGVRVMNFRAADVTSTAVSGFAGMDLQADNDAKVFLCPLVGASFGVGPDVGTIDVSTVRLRGGGQVGVIAYQASGLAVIPTFGLAAVYDRVRFDFGATDTTVSDGSGLANIGVGFIFNRNVSITPGVSIPFSAGNSDVIVTFALTFNFGR